MGQEQNKNALNNPLCVSHKTLRGGEKKSQLRKPLLAELRVTAVALFYCAALAFNTQRQLKLNNNVYEYFFSLHFRLILRNENQKYNPKHYILWYCSRFTFRCVSFSNTAYRTHTHTNMFAFAFNIYFYRYCVSRQRRISLLLPCQAISTDISYRFRWAAVCRTLHCMTWHAIARLASVASKRFTVPFAVDVRHCRGSEVSTTTNDVGTCGE